MQEGAPLLKTTAYHTRSAILPVKKVVSTISYLSVLLHSHVHFTFGIPIELKQDDKGGEQKELHLIMERILHTAVNDYLVFKYSRSDTRYVHALNWLFQDVQRDGDDISNLDTICEHLRLSKDRIRFVVNDYIDQKKRKLMSGEFDTFLNQCSID